MSRFVNLGKDCNLQHFTNEPLEALFKLAALIEVPDLEDLTFNGNFTNGLYVERDHWVKLMVRKDDASPAYLRCMILEVLRMTDDSEQMVVSADKDEVFLIHSRAEARVERGQITTSYSETNNSTHAAYSDGYVVMIPAVYVSPSSNRDSDLASFREKVNAGNLL